ncbi:MAG: hypothetical protein ACRDTH_06265 [Pseudonocardiaceae bacterium]
MTRCTVRAWGAARPTCSLSSTIIPWLAVGYRFGFAEDTVRLAAALEPALAARGVPATVYVDYADPGVMPTRVSSRCSAGVHGPMWSA